MCWSQRLGSQLAPFQMKESHLSSPLLSSSSLCQWLLPPTAFLHYLLAASRCPPACCLSAPPAPFKRPQPACPAFELPPPPYSSTLPDLLPCAYPPLFPACLPTEDCDCEGYFNGQYIGESVNIFLHLLLPICSLPVAAWLCAGSLVALGWGSN